MSHPQFKSIGTMLLLQVLVSASVSPADAEIAPRSGTFDGFYHQDVWGVGRFNYYLVHPDLHQQLAEFENTRIQIVVKDAIQPMNPGPAMITAIDSIRRLDPLPLQVTIETVPREIRPGEQFQAIVRIVNRGNRPLTVRNTDVSIGSTTARTVKDPNAISFFLPEYTRGQLSSAGRQFQMYDELANQSVWGYATLSGAHSFQVKPREGFPLVILYRNGLPRGVHEFKASCYVRTRGVDPSPKTVVWRRVDVDESNHPINSATELQVTESRFYIREDGYEGSINIAHQTNKSWNIVKCGDGQRRAYFGYLEAYDREGSSVPLDVEDAHLGKGQPEPWQLMSVGESGIELTVRFRHRTLFAPRGIKRLVLRLLTDQGLDALTLTDDFDDVHVPEAVPLGEPSNGVRLRIRPDKPTLAAGEPTFHVQAVNVGDEPIVWWMPKDKVGTGVTIEIDGKSIDGPKTTAGYHVGWAGKHLCDTPYEWTLVLPKEVKLRPGAHTIRYTVNSRGGTYRNAQNEPIPILNGTISTPPVSFRVE